MIDRTISSLTDLAQEICQAFLVPGEILLSAIGALSPRTTEILSFGHGGTVVTFVFALIIWTLILIAGLMISKWVRKFAWQVAAIFRTLVWRAKMYAGSLKTKLIWKYREFFPHKAERAEAISPKEFDSVDLALLRFVSDQGPGLAWSAPDLARKFNLRPAQIQDRLENLARNNIVRSVIGSSDGYENYRLTDSGLAFVAMWARQAESGSDVSLAFASESR